MVLPQDNPRPPSWYFKKWGLVLFLFLFGPLAFPFLCKSPVFSRRTKWILTVIFTVITVWVTLRTYEVIQAVIREYRQLGLTL